MLLSESNAAMREIGSLQVAIDFLDDFQILNHIILPAASLATLIFFEPLGASINPLQLFDGESLLDVLYSLVGRMRFFENGIHAQTLEQLLFTTVRHHFDTRYGCRGSRNLLAR